MSSESHTTTTAAQSDNQRIEEAITDWISGVSDYYGDVRQMKAHFDGFGSVDWEKTYTETEAKGKNYAEAGDYKFQQELLPNIINHSWDADGPKSMAGGTDWLAIGPPGSGKSNTALWLAARLMEANDEAIVWRGSPSRSEWLPFAPWATVCLPKGVDTETSFVPKNPTQETVSVDIEDVARNVVRYEDPIHLNEDLLESGTFHVVYPDPKMRGLQRIYDAAQEKQYDDVEFTPEDPLGHWWFGWMLARVEEGPFHWTSLFLDEIGDIAPQAARSDEYAHYQKIELFRDTLVDARKTGLSLFMFGHSEEDIHSMIRRKIRWRVTMATKANPTSKGDVVGFDEVPMDNSWMSSWDVGHFLPWNEAVFQFPPVEIPYFPDPVDMSLKVQYRGETAE